MEDIMFLNAMCLSFDLLGMNLNQCKEALTKGMIGVDKEEWCEKLDELFYTYIKPIPAYSHYDQLIDFPKREIQHTF